MASECTRIELLGAGDEPFGELTAYDVHGCGHQNKSWDGNVLGVPLSFPNLRSVKEWAHANGYGVRKCATSSAGLPHGA